MKAHIEKTRAGLGDLAVLANKTEAAERRILKQAESRLVEVSKEIEQARVGVDSAPDNAQERYLRLVAERGQLHTVIAKAKKALA